MTWKVRVTVKGYPDDGTGEAVELVSTGVLRLQGKTYYVLYEEVDEEENGDSGITKNMLKIEKNGKYAELVKKGMINAVMVFDTEQPAASVYETPYGRFLMEINTCQLDFRNLENRLELELFYILNLNHQPVSKNRITIIAERIL